MKLIVENSASTKSGRRNRVSDEAHHEELADMQLLYYLLSSSESLFGPSTLGRTRLNCSTLQHPIEPIQVNPCTLRWHCFHREGRPSSWMHDDENGRQLRSCDKQTISESIQAFQEDRGLLLCRVGPPSPLASVIPFFSVPEGFYALVWRGGRDVDDLGGSATWSPGLHWGVPWLKVRIVARRFSPCEDLSLLLVIS